MLRRRLRSPARWIRLALAAGVAGLFAPPDTAVASVVQRRNADLRADLRTLAHELPARHARAFHRIARRRFEQEVRDLDRQMRTDGDPDRAFVGMSRIVNSIGDGHTGMPYPVGAPLYGLRFLKFDDGFRLVARASGTDNRGLGGRLVSVGGVPISEVSKRLMALTPAGETQALRDVRAAVLLDRGMILHGLGLTDSRDHARFELRDDSGNLVKIDALAIPEDGAAWTSAAASPSLSTQNPQAPFSCALAAPGSLYCNFRSYQNLADNSGVLFDAIARTHPERLLLDLRQNGGGNFCDGLKYVVQPLIAHPKLNRRGGLYVLIGPETFSAAMSNSAHFRQKTYAILVGEAIGERPNSYQEAGDFTLPNSHWIVRYSERFYQFAPGAQNVIAPDKLIPRTWQDYQQGRDRAVEWILAQPMKPAPLQARWSGSNAPVADYCDGAE